jgi:hypothetical protein
MALFDHGGESAEKRRLAGDSGKDASASEAASGTVLALTPMPKIDLRDAHAIRRELAGVYRDMRAGRIASQDGTRLAYVLDMIRKAYETAVLTDRLELLERTINPRKD